MTDSIQNLPTLAGFIHYPCLADNEPTHNIWLDKRVDSKSAFHQSRQKDIQPYKTLVPTFIIYIRIRIMHLQNIPNTNIEKSESYLL